MLPDHGSLWGYRFHVSLSYIDIITLPIERHPQETTRIVSTLIVSQDYYIRGHCTNYNPILGERIMMIDTNRISVAVPNVDHGYEFQIRQCNPSAGSSSHTRGLDTREYGEGWSTRPAPGNAENVLPSRKLLIPESPQAAALGLEAEDEHLPNVQLGSTQ